MTVVTDYANIAPGIYQRPEIDYDRIPALNQSRLKPIAKSPLHCKAGASIDGKAGKPYMRLGNAAHCAVLEPARYERSFVPYVPPVDCSDRFAGTAYERFCEAHAPATVIKQKEHESSVRIAAEVRRNRVAQRYLQRGVAEVILVWREPKFGNLLCKARLDWLSLSVRDVMCELKTARDISPRPFGTVFASYGYDVQAAYYCRGYRAITGRALYPKCIAVESDEPHDVIVYNLLEAVEVGDSYVEEYLAKYAECVARDQWPGQCPDTELELQLPAWRRGDDDEGDLAGMGLVIEGDRDGG